MTRFHPLRPILVLAMTALAALSCGSEQPPDAGTPSPPAAEPDPGLSPESASSTVYLPETPDTTGLALHLEYPGLGFEYLPGFLSSLAEGDLLEDRGSVYSGPNELGADLRFVYRTVDLETPAEREEWLKMRLMEALPPDSDERLLLSDAKWREGSMLSAERASASLGLVCYYSFNLVDERGSIHGRGRAYGIFRNGYATMAFCISPMEHAQDVMDQLDLIIDYARLTRRS
ncbi:hypothetical protein JW921_03270 [Candidatus Fermentibacterales bacterium]|nr:hypothetical protein [Candidatus Fermentibacterales bacterium]